MRNLFVKLEQRGMEFTENHKVYVILSSLPEDYNVLVTSLESMSERDLTLEYLTGRLLEEEDKRNERSQVRMRDDIPQYINGLWTGMGAFHPKLSGVSFTVPVTMDVMMSQSLQKAIYIISVY